MPSPPSHNCLARGLDVSGSGNGDGTRKEGEDGGSINPSIKQRSRTRNLNVQLKFCASKSTLYFGMFERNVVDVTDADFAYIPDSGPVRAAFNSPYN